MKNNLLKQVIEVKEEGKNMIIGKIRPPIFPLDRIYITDDKAYKINYLHEIEDDICEFEAVLL